MPASTAADWRLSARSKASTTTAGAITPGRASVDSMPASTPAHIVRLIQRCLDKDPKQRLRDIADARIEIEDGIVDEIDVASGHNMTYVPPGFVTKQVEIGYNSSRCIQRLISMRQIGELAFSRSVSEIQVISTGLSAVGRGPA